MTMSLTIHIGNDESRFVTNEHAEKSERQEKRTTLFAGDLAVCPDRIAIKRQQAQKKAMKVLNETFDSEKQLEQNLDELSNKRQSCEGENVENYRILQEIATARKERMELGDIDSEKYQKDMKEFHEREKIYQGYIQDNEKEISEITAALRNIKIERLKSEPMVEAQKQSEQILAAANKEIYGELMNESKNYIEEKMEEEKQKAEERAEKKEEEEERLEKKQEKEEIQEENQKELIEKTQVQQPKIERKLEEILDELKLIQEDLKGVVVDSGI